jgi:hypothetical protein
MGESLATFCVREVILTDLNAPFESIQVFSCLKKERKENFRIFNA